LLIFDSKLIKESSMSERIRTHKELFVFQRAMQAAMEIFKMTKLFPSEEKYSLVDQIRRSSRSVCANIAEAWRKRRYKAAFISKLSDAETESCETQVWLEFAYQCNYLNLDQKSKLEKIYDIITGQIVRMIKEPDKWIL
jgi:four helix bundle protein